MNPVPTTCPVCHEKLTVRKLQCRNCDTSIEGHFELGLLGNLNPDQLIFIETFIRCEGKLNRVEKVLGMSYPTLRARLTEIIRTMDSQVDPERELVSDDERHRILHDLANGRISSAEAARFLEGESSLTEA